MGKNKKVLRMILMMLLLPTLSGCINLQSSLQNGSEEYRVIDLEIYRDTDAWELAKAVNAQNTKKIKSIAEKNPALLNVQDPYYDTTLLVWAVGMEKYDSAKALLECGADPDIISGWVGCTALYLAAGFSWIDNDAKQDLKYVNLLLEYGADPNICYITKGLYANEYGVLIQDGTEDQESPLMHSIGAGLEKTKALVEAGADINHKTPKMYSAAIKALYSDGAPKYAQYLIVEKKADLTGYYLMPDSMIMSEDDPNKKFYPVDLLKWWRFAPGTEGYEIKQAIIQEFANQGIEYSE